MRIFPHLFLTFASMTIAATVHAETIVDPFNEGNTAVSRYFDWPDSTYFEGVIAGLTPSEDGGIYDGTPGYGDVLFSGGDYYVFEYLATSYIGVAGEPMSRGRVYVDGAGTEIYSGGLKVAGNGSLLSLTNGARVDNTYGISITDSVEGGDTAQLIISGRDSYLSEVGGESFFGGRLFVDSGIGEARMMVNDGGRVSVYGIDYGEFFPDALSLADINADFEVSGAGSIFETSHRLHLTSGEGESARVINGGRIVQTDDIGTTLERPIAFSYNGGTSEASGLLVSGLGSRIELVNDALFGDGGYVTLRDGGSVITQGSVFVEGASPGAMKVVMDRGRIDASEAMVIDDGGEVVALDGSTIRGDVNIAGGTLAVERSGLTISGDLTVGTGVLALEVGQSPAVAVEGTALFGPGSFLRLLLSSVPNGEILVDDYLLADSIEFAPQFSLAAQMDVQIGSDVDLSDGAVFSVRFAGLDQTVAYRYIPVAQVPEIDGAGFPLIAGLLLMIFALRRERNR